MVHFILECLTFIFLKHFSGCSQPTFFKGEKADDKLSLLKHKWEKNIDLTKRNCHINTISSWYIDCEGKKVTVASAEISMANMFEIEKGSREYDFEVKKEKCEEEKVVVSPLVVIKISAVCYVLGKGV